MAALQLLKQQQLRRRSFLEGLRIAIANLKLVEYVVALGVAAIGVACEGIQTVDAFQPRNVCFCQGNPRRRGRRRREAPPSGEPAPGESLLHPTVRRLAASRATTATVESKFMRDNLRLSRAIAQVAVRFNTNPRFTEPPIRVELMTYGLRNRCSTN